MSKATERTLRLFKRNGYRCEMVERWIPMKHLQGGGKRRDFMGIIDILAMDTRHHIGIQTTGTEYAKHMDYLLGDGAKDVLDWLSYPATRMVMIGWRRVRAYKADGTVTKMGGGYTYKPRCAELLRAGPDYLVADESFSVESGT